MFVVGKLVASGAIMAGVMVLALPITIIVNNFMHVSRMNQTSIHTLGQAFLTTQNNKNDVKTTNSVVRRASNLPPDKTHQNPLV
jgi:hypothetical protein